MRKLLVRGSLFAAAVFLFAAILQTTNYQLPTAFAQTFTITQPNNTGPRSTGTPGTLVNNALQTVIAIFFTVGAIGLIVMLMWGAVQWILSGGDKEALSKAKGRITNALIGITLLALTFVIVEIVGGIIGFNPLGPLSIPSFTDSSTPAKK